MLEYKNRKEFLQKAMLQIFSEEAFVITKFVSIVIIKTKKLLKRFMKKN